MGATVFAAIVSVLLSLLLSSLLAKPITPLVNSSLEGMLASMDSLTQSIVGGLLEGMVAMLVATLLFPLLFLILSICARLVASRLSRDKFAPTNKGLHWGGLGVGVVDTLVYTLVLLLPLYGTIGSIAPTLGGLMDEESGAVFQEAESHPLVSISGAGPFGLVYDTLTVVSTDGGSIEPIKMVREISEISAQVQTILEKNPEEYGAEDLQQIQIVCDRIVEGGLFYQTANVLYEELQVVGQMENVEFEGSLTFKEKEIKEMGEQLTDLLSTVLDALAKEDEAALESIDPPAEIGEALNSSPSAASLKFTLYNFFIHKAVGEHVDGQIFQQQLVGMLSTEPLTDPEQIKAEGELIMQLFQEGFSESDVSALLSLLAKHPQIDEETINEIRNVLADEAATF